MRKHFDLIKDHILGIFVLALMIIIFIAHSYKLSILIMHSQIFNYSFASSLSIFILTILLFLLIYEKRKFALKFAVFVYSYIAFLAISSLILKRLALAGFIVNIVICSIIIIYSLTHKKIRGLLIE